jgi:uncharacterized DUF497 family protein
MRFEWDPEKNRANVEKHGIDFSDASRLFEGLHVTGQSTQRHEEPRMIAIGVVNGREIAVVYTLRGTVRRIISARRARTNERKQYWEAIQKRDGLEAG